MDWLNRLLFADVPAGTTLQSAEWTFRGPWPGWLAAIVLLGCLAAVGMLYARESARVSWFRRCAMAVARMAALGLLIGLVMKPVVVAEFAGERPRGVAVMLDNSQSFQQTDRRVSPRDRIRVGIARGSIAANANPDDPQWLSAATEMPENPTRSSVARSSLENPQFDIVNALKRLGPLKLYTFGQQLRSIPEDAKSSPATSLLSVFRSDEERTALADGVAEVLQRRDGDAPAAIVLITDGLDNASKLPLDEAARECKRLGVPLHIYGVGSSEAGILQLKDAAIPETIFFDDTVSIPVRWRGQGFKNGVGVVSATLGGRVVASREVQLKDGQVGKTTITFTPERRGGPREERQDIVVTLRSKDDPSYFDEVRRNVQLVDRKVKVLVIEGDPRWEFKFLMPTLLRDRRVEASFLLIGGDPKLLRNGPPFLPEFPERDKLFGYDLIILGDVPVASLGPERQSVLQDFAREGGGLVIIAGRQHLPSEYDGSALAEVLPVEIRPTKYAVDPTSRPLPFTPLLTPAGERSAMLTLADSPEENLRTWRELPGLFWYYPASKLRPGATTLLGHPTAGLGDAPMPLIATHYYGKGQVLFLAADETWRWRYNAQEKLYARFWGQVVYQLGLPHLLGNANRVQVALDRGEAILGRPGYIYARLLDGDYRPLTEPRVTATLLSLDAPPGEGKSRQVTMDAIAGRPGEYRAFLPHDLPGRFELKLTRPEAAAFSYRVQLPPQHELEPAGLAEGPLRELAQSTGGRFYHEEDLPELVKSIQPKNAAFSVRREILMWNPLVLLLFVGLVTAEWVMRKFANLS